VVLWGKGLPVEEVARCADTIAYELVCQVTHRVRRVFVGEEAVADPQGAEAGQSWSRLQG
jgi:hypothetical protein